MHKNEDHKLGITWAEWLMLVLVLFLNIGSWISPWPLVSGGIALGLSTLPIGFLLYMRWKDVQFHRAMRLYFHCVGVRRYEAGYYKAIPPLPDADDFLRWFRQMGSPHTFSQLRNTLLSLRRPG